MQKNNPTKNGIKLLSESQLKVTLPSISLLDDKLYEIRKNAYEAKLSAEIDMHFDHLKYDNIRTKRSLKEMLNDIEEIMSYQLS